MDGLGIGHGITSHMFFFFGTYGDFLSMTGFDDYWLLFDDYWFTIQRFLIYLFSSTSALFYLQYQHY